MSLIPQLLRETYEPTTSTPAVDWKETPEAHVLKADVPGLSKGDVRIEVEDNGRAGRILKISGDRPAEGGGDKNEKWRHVERPRGGFVRRFYLPESAKTDEVKAAMENGVLTVTVPKQEMKKPEVKNIEIVGN